MIKKIMCFCGSGLGTSFVMEMNAKKALKNLGIEGVTVEHSTIDDVVPGAADLFICSADLLPNAKKSRKSHWTEQYGGCKRNTGKTEGSI